MNNISKPSIDIIHHCMEEYEKHVLDVNVDTLNHSNLKLQFRISTQLKNSIKGREKEVYCGKIN